MVLSDLFHGIFKSYQEAKRSYPFLWSSKVKFKIIHPPWGMEIEKAKMTLGDRLEREVTIRVPAA